MEPLFQSIKNLTMSIFFTIALAFMDLAYFSPQEDHKAVKFDSQYTGNVNTRGSQYIQSSTLPEPLFPMLPSPARAASQCSQSTTVGHSIILSDTWGRQSNALFRKVVGTASPCQENMKVESLLQGRTRHESLVVTSPISFIPVC